MLPATHRLRRSADFARAVRRGRRAARRTVVLHLAEPQHDDSAARSVSSGSADPGGGDRRRASTQAPVVGFVVSRQVGPAVVRNRVKRRLRHLMSERVVCLPEGAVLVVRANPVAAAVTATELGADLDGALSRLLGPASRHAQGRGRR